MKRRVQLRRGFLKFFHMNIVGKVGKGGNVSSHCVRLERTATHFHRRIAPLPADLSACLSVALGSLRLLCSMRHESAACSHVREDRFCSPHVAGVGYLRVGANIPHPLPHPMCSSKSLYPVPYRRREIPRFR